MLRVLQILLFIAMAALLSLSIAGMLGFAIWQAEMITPFRPQLLLMAIVGLGLSLASRHKYLICLAIAVIAGLPIPQTLAIFFYSLANPTTLGVMIAVGLGKTVKFVFLA